MPLYDDVDRRRSQQSKPCDFFIVGIPPPGSGLHRHAPQPRPPARRSGSRRFVHGAVHRGLRPARSAASLAGLRSFRRRRRRRARRHHHRPPLLLRAGVPREGGRDRPPGEREGASDARSPTVLGFGRRQGPGGGSRHRRGPPAQQLRPLGPRGAGPCPLRLGVWGAGPVMGSAAIALAAAILLGPGRPTLQLSALCGSFAGMARLAVVPGFASSAVLGAACALALAAFDRGGWLVGRGGRLGFIAQVACTGTYLLLRHGVPLLPAPFGGFLGTGTLASGPSALIDRAMYGDLPSWIGAAAAEAAWPLIPSAVLGAFAMRAWMAAARGAEDVVGGEGPAGWAARRLGTPTAAVGATGALSALLLPPAGAGMAYVGSFVAMSAPSVLGGGWALGLASALSAVAWAIPMKGLLLGGWGGKMGTAALVGVLSYDALRPVVDRATGGFRREGGDEDKES